MLNHHLEIFSNPQNPDRQAGKRQAERDGDEAAVARRVMGGCGYGPAPVLPALKVMIFNEVRESLPEFFCLLLTPHNPNA